MEILAKLSVTNAETMPNAQHTPVSTELTYIVPVLTWRQYEELLSNKSRRISFIWGQARFHVCLTTVQMLA